MKVVASLVFALLVCAAPAFANVTVVSPASGTEVVSPFQLAASATACSSQPISAMGYSFDNSTNTTIVNGTSINTQVSSATGAHVLYVKSWGNQGASCMTQVSIVVTAASAITVLSPASGMEVVSPFQLTASAAPCSSQPIAAMGYSFDNSTSTTIVNGASINAQVASVTGAHTLHVKSWGNQGASCVTSVAVIVMPGPTSYVPADAVVFKAVQNLPTWQAVNDSGSGGGTSNGTMSMASTPSLSSSARKFATTFTNYGGQRYFATIGANTAVSNFLYDGWIYLAAPSSGIANVEMDMNQVMANGETVIYGFQCDGWSGTWDYTANEGTPKNPSDQWLHSQATCNPRNWSTNAWHHVQVTYSRDEQGTVTYESVWLDGVEQDLNATAPSAFALGWGPVLLTNFQVDGATTSGSSTVYLDNLTVYGW